MLANSVASRTALKQSPELIQLRTVKSGTVFCRE